MKTAWDVADEKIQSYIKKLERAEKGEGKMSVATCKAMIDKWLEYRFEHGPDDLSLKA